MKRRGLNFMGYTFLDESFIELWEQLLSSQCFKPTPSLPQYNMKEEAEKSLTPEEKEKTAAAGRSCMTGCGCGFTDLV
jgi:hypothetical protein